MGQDEGDINERPEHDVELDYFAIDRTEVSAAEFAEFLEVSGNPDGVYFTPDEFSTVVASPAQGGSRKTSFAPRPGYERYPANNVSWKGADAYCRWRGKRLPTEAEWEKAARGTDRRLFPWGQAIPREREARFKQVWEQKQFDVLAPVDALPEGASPYGALNMAGNVLEWVSDWYRQNLCDFCNPGRENNLDLVVQLTGTDDEPSGVDRPGAGTTEAGSGELRQKPPRVNPGGPSSGAFKVLRGGSWQDPQVEDLETTRRYWLDPAQRFPNTGLRCSQEISPEP